MLKQYPKKTQHPTLTREQKKEGPKTKLDIEDFHERFMKSASAKNQDPRITEDWPAQNYQDENQNTILKCRYLFSKNQTFVAASR